MSARDPQSDPAAAGKLSSLPVHDGRIVHLSIDTVRFPDGSVTDEFIHLFLAEDLREGKTAYDHDEFIELARMPFSRALELVRRGEITDGKTICSLLYARFFLCPPTESSR